MPPPKMAQWASISLALLLIPTFASADRHSQFIQTSGSQPRLTLSLAIPCGLTLHSPGCARSLNPPDAPQSSPAQGSTSAGETGKNDSGAAEQHQALAQHEERQLGEFSSSRNLLPDAPSHSLYMPLSSSDKLGLSRHTSATDLLLGVTFDAGWAQLTNDWPGYGQGMQGFGKRWGALMADREASGFLGSFLFPTLLHQDPRYFRLGAGQTFLHRMGYALTRVVVARKDDGGNTFNSSLVLSTLVVKSLTNAYYPQQQRGFSQTMNRVGGSLLGSVQSSVLREFLPDIVGILQKHMPERLRQLGNKLPFREHWRPTYLTNAAGVLPRPAE